MVERSPTLTALSHLILLLAHLLLLLGAAIVCVPLYFAFVAGSLSGPELRQVPAPLLPGESGGGWEVAMAESFLVMLPPVLVTVARQRWFARGLVDAGK